MKKIESSFNGEIPEIPGIFVDNFERPTIQKAKAYFLSHFHTDHTVGLDSELLLEKLKKEKNVFIYATKLTGAIILYNYEKLRPFVKVLSLGSNLITVNSTSNETELFLNIILIPAGHCVGSTMFLFQTTSINILYTGDFRIRPKDLPKYKLLHDENGEVIKLDALYVDTTFINDKYDDFPKRTESVESIVDMISRWCRRDQVFIVLDTSATYGYEHIFNEIYKVTKMKVYVCPERWNFYSTIQHLVPGVTNDPQSGIFLKQIPESVNMKTKKFRRIRFSAMPWKNWSDDKPSIASKGEETYSVCFATHCSRNELISFVEYMNPTKIIGFPYRYSPGVLDHGREDQFPETSAKRPRKDKMIDDKIMKEMFGPKN